MEQVTWAKVSTSPLKMEQIFILQAIRMIEWFLYTMQKDIRGKIF